MVKLFSVLVMVFVADLQGRRQFLIGGTTVMLLGLIALCVGLAQNYYTVALIGMYVHPNTSYIHALILIYSYMHARMHK